MDLALLDPSPWPRRLAHLEEPQLPHRLLPHCSAWHVHLHHHRHPAPLLSGGPRLHRIYRRPGRRPARHRILHRLPHHRVPRLAHRQPQTALRRLCRLRPLRSGFRYSQPLHRPIPPPRPNPSHRLCPQLRLCPPSHHEHLHIDARRNGQRHRPLQHAAQHWRLHWHRHGHNRPRSPLRPPPERARRKPPPQRLRPPTEISRHCRIPRPPHRSRPGPPRVLRSNLRLDAAAIRTHGLRPHLPLDSTSGLLLRLRRLALQKARQESPTPNRHALTFERERSHLRSVRNWFLLAAIVPSAPSKATTRRMRSLGLCVLTVTIVAFQLLAQDAVYSPQKPTPAKIEPQLFAVGESVVLEQWTHTLKLVNAPQQCDFAQSRTIDSRRRCCRRRQSRRVY